MLLGAMQCLCVQHWRLSVRFNTIGRIPSLNSDSGLFSKKLMDLISIEALDIKVISPGIHVRVSFVNVWAWHGGCLPGCCN